MSTDRIWTLPSWLRALAILLVLVTLPVGAAELNNSGTGQWSESDSSNTSAQPDGWPVGLAPNQVRGVGQAMMGATKRFWDRINCTVTSGGSANAYTYTPTNTNFPTAIVAGEIFCFKANFTNTAAATLAVNGLTAKNIFKPSPAGPIALTGNEIRSGQFIPVAYDGTQYVIIGGSTPSGLSFLLKTGTAVTAPADTNENIVATINLAANAQGANGTITIEANLTLTNNANSKTIRVRHSGIGGTTIFSANVAGNTIVTLQGMGANLNATNSQAWFFRLFGTGATPLTVANKATAAIDTTAATTIVITAQKATAGDTVTLDSALAVLASDGS